MKTYLKYLLLLVVAIIIGVLAGWLVGSVLGITSTAALNTIRGAWILGILVGFLFGRNWKKWRNLWGF